MAIFEARWSGEYPCLCSGEWTIYRNGMDVSNAIPVSLKSSPMDTRKEYAAYGFDENWDEVCSVYWSGLSAKKWIRKNRDWIAWICATKEEAFELYHAINRADWRHSSCGGCL